MTDDDYDALSQKKLASIKRDMRESLENAAIRATHKVMAEFEAKSDERLMEPPPEFIDALKYDVARRDSEFFTHCVDQPYDWSDWVCPDPKSYLMKCCDCGLVHEAQFGVVRYKSDTDREDCDMVDDPNLQAVFRMRRSEQWSPADMAHRAGGLTMEQPARQVVDSNEKAGAYMEARLWEFIDMAAAWPKASPDPRTWDHVMVYAPKPAQQEPVAVVSGYYGGQCVILPIDPARIFNSNTALYTSPPAQRTWVDLTDEEFQWVYDHGRTPAGMMEMVEAKLKEKNT